MLVIPTASHGPNRGGPGVAQACPKRTRRPLRRSIRMNQTTDAMMPAAVPALVLVTGSTLLFLLQFPLGNLALCLLFARTAPTARPLIARLAAEVVSLRPQSAAHPGLQGFFRGATWLWAGIFAASTIGLAVPLAFESTAVFLMLTTVVTVAGVAAGIGLSVFWFIRVLRRSGLRVRFGAA